MFSERLDRLRSAVKHRTLGVRLALGYAVLFAVSMLLIFGLAYALMVDFMRAQDRALLESKLQAFAAVYVAGGAERLRQQLQDDAQAEGPGAELTEDLLVRVADAQNQTLYSYHPDWSDEALQALARRPLPQSGTWLHLPTGGEVLEVGTRHLPGGAVLQVGMSAADRDDALESFRSVFIAVALPMMLMALLGGAFMAYRALRPVRRLRRTLQAVVDTGDLHERVATGPERGEFAELTRLFNRMIERIEALVAGMRGALDNVAHDLRTPMTRLRGRAELALQGSASEEAYREALGDALEASDAVLATLDTLMDVSEAQAGTMELDTEAVRVADLARDVVDLYRFAADEKGVALDAALPADLQVTVDPVRIRQALANLLDNAVKYTPSGGSVVVSARAAGPDALIEVRDSGIGIPSEELDQIWDRLFRGDGSRTERGTGLGLSFVKAIVEAHGGTVEAESAPDEGSLFRVRLPRA